MKILVVLLGLFFSGYLQAGAYKCKDDSGKTTYQAKPCHEEKEAVEIDLKTGTFITHEVELRQKEQERQKQQQALSLQQQKQQLIAATKKQSDYNQAFIKTNQALFSAYAIPPYTLEKMPENAKHFQWRLPEIEKYRRLAAKKVLETGQCQRVEASELNIKSTREQLIILVDCRSGKQVYLTEQELAETDQ